MKHILHVFLAIISLAWLNAAHYTELLTLKPLPQNKVLASFAFGSVLPPFPLEYNAVENSDQEIRPGVSIRHYGQFPKTIEPIIHSTNTRQLHLRFTQGWWNSDMWGALPQNGSLSGGTGVEVLATIEAPNLAAARQSWRKLAESLSGFFCASLNFIDDAITTFPRHDSRDIAADYVADSHTNNTLFLMRAALPDEPICTENLTPFLKLLPTRGKAGVGSLLDGHKLYDSLWHSMSIDLVTECNQLLTQCQLNLTQNIHHVIDVSRSLRRVREGGIPKPTPGLDLRCDLSKKHDPWVCFPLPDSADVEWDLESIFGRPIKGAGFEGQGHAESKIYFDVHDDWSVQMEHSGETYDVKPEETLQGAENYNAVFRTANSSLVTELGVPPIKVSRSLTGYSQDRGGMRIKLNNPANEPIKVVFFETLPWFMRVYLHTLKVSGAGQIKTQFYKPALDRTRPGHLELEIDLPAGGEIAMTYQFDKSLLLYSEYPPDANHGFAIAPSVVKVLDATGKTVYQLRSTSLLLTLPTPDFSMPYNVIILTCTVMSLAFGTIFNLLTKKVVTEEEFEEASKNSKVARLKATIRRFTRGGKKEEK